MFIIEMEYLMHFHRNLIQFICEEHQVCPLDFNMPEEKDQFFIFLQFY